MVVEKKYQVAISKNAKGEIVECLECPIVGGETYKAYKKESALSKEKAKLVAQEEKEKLQKAIDNLESKINRQNLLVAKCFFDNEVASGKCDTNELFESDFDNFVYGKVALELKNAPKEFIAILERLG